MRLPSDPSPRFIRIEGTAITAVTVTSRVRWWRCHFTAEGRGRRCAGNNCALCLAGSAPDLRFVLGVTMTDGTRGLLELRSRHRAVLEILADDAREGVGAVLWLCRLGTAKNSPIEIEFKRFVAGVAEWDIASLVDSLGLPPITSANAPPLRVAEA